MTYHLMPHLRSPLQERRNAKRVLAAERQAVEDNEPTYKSTPLGDPRVLRGIPCLAPGVGSTIAGTAPHTLPFLPRQQAA